ncbi:MAG: LCP family protein, partial [Candidatus Gracilibacteria bacterium]|nr:LCP family protein [Candidatus Gracilibacteria bacterium]
KLDKYIVIDMYAFIDVVNLIGGIDVRLGKALIDPTYKTIDNGVEGTLHYEPGEYHLGGKEALRIARSRHTSSDFDRAARQQIILEALQTKARNMGIGNANTIYEIIKAVLAKTETDISFEEAVAYFFRYQNYTIVSNAVMSSGNVLYVPPYIKKEDCDAMVYNAQMNGLPIPDCQSANQAYTLLPKDNDWNVVKWFFQREFKGLTVAVEIVFPSNLALFVI